MLDCSGWADEYGRPTFPSTLFLGHPMLNHTLELVRGHNSKELPYYTQCVTKSFAAVDPVFLRKRYDQLFFYCASTVPGWLAQVVLGNAPAE
jgi:hypothetical protein